MNREILFRGKRVDNGEWIEGNYNLLEIGSNLVPIIIPFQNLVKAMMSDVFMYQVDLSTVGQYTDLTDRNGVRIFEGDIVNVKTISGSFINYVITWFNSDLCWVMQSLKDTSVKFRLRSCWEFEVVDNIHDNPELLKGEPNV